MGEYADDDDDDDYDEKINSICKEFFDAGIGMNQKQRWTKN